MPRSATKREPFAFKIVARAPTLEEFERLIDAVGWARYVNMKALTKVPEKSIFGVVAVHERRVIGSGRLVGDGVRNVFVQDIVVLPEYQRRGVGTAIMDALMKWINDRTPSKTYVQLFTEKKNADFYARYGFKGSDDWLYGMSVKKFDEPLRRTNSRRAPKRSAKPEAGAHSAPGPSPVSASKVTAVRCVLAVNDLAKSVEFYRKKLGFNVDFTAPGWSFLSRGNFKLMLGHCPDEKPAREIGDHSWFVYVDVEKVDELCGECRRNGVTIFEDIADKPYGMREFGVATPDG